MAYDGDLLASQMEMVCPLCPLCPLPWAKCEVDPGLGVQPLPHPTAYQATPRTAEGYGVYDGALSLICPLCQWLALVGYSRDPRQACPCPDGLPVGKSALTTPGVGMRTHSQLSSTETLCSFVQTLLPQPGVIPRTVRVCVRVCVRARVCVCVCVCVCLCVDHRVRKGFRTSRTIEAQCVLTE